MIATPISALCFGDFRRFLGLWAASAARTRRRLLSGIALGVLLSPVFEPCRGAETDQSYTLFNLKEVYRQTREVLQKSPEDPDAAWQFARACFDLADFDEPSRAKVAEEGVNACRKALQHRTNTATYYYCALDLGQLARTKKLGALKLVDEMEASLKKALELDPKFDYAGPHRTLGLLYTDAPGWPMSIGSRSKAKQHLLKAVALEPDYPENHIALIESHLSWGDLKSARKAAAEAEPYIRASRVKFAGDRWKESWKDWDKRWERIRRKTESDFSSPRGSP